MARIEAIEHRLLNWARWKAGRSIRYAGACPTNSGMPRSPYADAPIPVSDCEASETDEAIDKALLPTSRLTVYTVYLAPGGEADRLKTLGCSKAAMHERIGVAHRALAHYFAGLAERRRTERERVEALHRGRRA